MKRRRVQPAISILKRRRSAIESQPCDAPVTTHLSRPRKVRYVLALLKKKGEGAAEQLRQFICKGKPLKAQGQIFEADVLSESLKEWTCSNVLETLTESVKTALEAVPQTPIPTSEAALSSLRQELCGLSAESGLIGACLASSVHARDVAKSQKDNFSIAVQQNRDTVQKAAAATGDFQRARAEAQKRHDYCREQIRQHELQICKLSEEVECSVLRLSELECNIAGEEKKAAEAESWVEHHVKAAASAMTDMQLLDTSTFKLSFKVQRAEEKIQELDQAISKKVVGGESEFLTWTRDNVATWLKRCENGRYSAHSHSFWEQEITGKMLLALTPEDLTRFGMCELNSRRALLDAIGRLRSRIVLEGASAAGPPDEMLCPITQECLIEPVAVVGDEQGHAYERSAIERWFAEGHVTMPVTGVRLDAIEDRQLLPLRALARKAREWRLSHMRADGLSESGG